MGATACGSSLDSHHEWCNDAPMLSAMAIALRVLAVLAAGDDGETTEATGVAGRPRLCELDNWNLASGKLGPKDADGGRVDRNERLRLEVWVPDGWCINARDVFEWQVDYVTISRPDRQDARLHLGPYAPRRDGPFSSWRQWTARHLRRALPGKAQTISGWPVLWLPSKVTKSGRNRRTEEVQGIIGLGVRAPDDEGYAYFAVLEWDLPFDRVQDFRSTVEKMLGSLRVSAPPR